LIRTSDRLTLAQKQHLIITRRRIKVFIGCNEMWVLHDQRLAVSV